MHSQSRRDGALIGVVSVSVAGYTSSTILLALLLGVVSAYEFYRLGSAEILVFDDSEREKHKKYIWVSPKYAPAISFLSKIAGIILLLLGLVIVIAFENAEIDDYIFPAIVIGAGVAGLWVGSKISSKG